MMLTHTKMLELVGATEEIVRDADKRLLPFFSPFEAAGTLHKLWLDGVYRCDTVNIEGIPSIVVFHHMANRSTLMIDGAVTLVKASSKVVKELFEAADLLAKKHHARAISFQSLRGGMAKFAVECGFVPIAVCYQKSVN